MTSSRDWWVTPLLTLIAGALVVGALFHGVALLLSSWVCGTAAHPASGQLSGLYFALTGNASLYTAPSGCQFPAAAVRITDLVIAIIFLAALLLATIWWVRYQQSDAWFIRELRTRPGFAKSGEVSRHLSGRAMVKRAKTLRPTLRSPKPTDVGFKLGTSSHIDVFVSIEDSIALVGSPRSGKGFRILISGIIDWAGPLITTSTTNDNLTATRAMRATRGNVIVFDPQELSGVRTSMRISPISGCADPLIADQRAQAIIAGTALGASRTNQEWAQTSSGILARLLHAAAISGGDVDDLYHWGSNPGLARGAVDVLRSDGTPGWADDLDAVINGDEKLLSSSWFGVAGAVRPLSIPAIRETLSPRPGEAFDAEEFLNGANTLYLIGSGAGAGSMGGFLGALLDDIVETARRKALASPGSRLDLPLGLILDEIANMFSWPALPRIMADGGGRGISTLVVLQALSQAESAWSKAEADTIWSAATAKILLGGASDVSYLRDIEALLGTRQVRQNNRSYNHQGSSTSEHQERVPVMTVDEIRRMPESLGLLAYRNRRGVLLDLRGWTDRQDAKHIGAGKRETEAAQQHVFQQQYRDRSSAEITEPAVDVEDPVDAKEPN